MHVLKLAVLADVFRLVPVLNEWDAVIVYGWLIGCVVRVMARAGDTSPCRLPAVVVKIWLRDAASCERLLRDDYPWLVHYIKCKFDVWEIVRYFVEQLAKVVDYPATTLAMIHTAGESAFPQSEMLETRHMINAFEKTLWRYLPKWLQVIVDHIEIVNQDGFLRLCVSKPLVETWWRVARISTAVLTLNILKRLGLSVYEYREVNLGF